MASTRSARARRSAARTPSGTSAVSTFSAALSVGIRLKDWKMNPIDRARTRVTTLSRIRPRSWWPNSTVPDVGRSRPPSNCSRVDLPPPVGPWMASHSPSPITRSTPPSAVTAR